MRLLVIVGDKFNDIELTSTLSVLIASEQMKSIEYYSNNLTHATGQFGIVKLRDLKNKVDVNDYDAVFIPGGMSAQALRANKPELDLVREFLNNNKYLFTICDAPNALREAEIFDNNFHYSSYPSQWGLLVAGSNRNESNVTIQGKVITARNALSAAQLGYTILKVYFNKDLANQTYHRMSGNKNKDLF
ncbi:DJ-1/PfpI family protein [Mycoplasma nasistruthionis]|uniref:DJ-1 family protein n=1 Tax=Mycoplasma nasistruthionis TaxID=353852 RepID=A0A5B7XVW9_9MOLU|nr:DJ-1/PfpI family protein [Mycoplasma nasistruthionis]QCZ36857.1 DJ-1 family protein [Mycoplasma nasistruthionis]